MDRPLPRALVSFGLSILAVVLIWGGHEIWQGGRATSAEEFRFPTKYLLGAQLLWLFSGIAGAGIIRLSTRTRERSVPALLAASIVPLLVVVPMYIWTNPDLPSWLQQITPTPDWIVSPYVQTAAPVLLGVLLGSAIRRHTNSPANRRRTDVRRDENT